MEFENNWNWLWPLIISSNSLVKAETALKLDVMAQALCSQVLNISKDDDSQSSLENLLQYLAVVLYVPPAPAFNSTEICRVPVSFALCPFGVNLWEALPDT